MLKRLLAGLLIPLLTATACAPRWSAAGPRLRPQTKESADAPRSPDVWRQLAHRLTPGSRINVQLTDGTRMRAVFLVAEDEVFILKRKTRVPEPEQRIAYGTVESLELDSNGGIGAGKAAAIGIGTGAATFLALIMITFALVDD